MPRILIADSTPDTALVASLEGMGHAVTSAPDGAEAFDLLLLEPHDCLLTESKLAKLDAIELIKKIRARGMALPIVLRTFATKTSELGPFLAQGQVHYVYRGGDSQELRRTLAGLFAKAAPAPVEAPKPVVLAMPATGRILLIDSNVAVYDELRARLPVDIELETSPNAKEGFERARAGQYNAVLFDSHTSGLNISGTISQLRHERPDTAAIGIATIGRNDDESNLVAQVHRLGVDDVLVRPFTQAAVERVCEQYCTSLDHVVLVRDNTIRVSRLRSRGDRRAEYLRRIERHTRAALPQMVDACFDEATVDFSQVQGDARDAISALCADLQREAAAMNLALKVISPA